MERQCHRCDGITCDSVTARSHALTPVTLSLSVTLSLIPFQRVTGFHAPRVVDVKIGDRLVHAASAISRSLTLASTRERLSTWSVDRCGRALVTLSYVTLSQRGSSNTESAGAR
jgi:hypothetical protein